MYVESYSTTEWQKHVTGKNAKKIIQTRILNKISPKMLSMDQKRPKMLIMCRKRPKMLILYKKHIQKLAV
jgi:hypothetical protein